MVDDLASIAARHGAAAEPVWVWDADRQDILWANEAALALFGTDSLFDLIDFVFAPGAPEARAAQKAGEGIETTIAPMGTPMRVRLDVSAIAMPYADNARLIVVREVKPPPEDMAMARRAALFEFTPAAMVLADLEGTIVEANAAATMANGAEVRRLGDLLGEAPAKRLIAHALAAGDASVSVVVHGRTLRAAALRLADPSGGGAAVLVRIEDVTAKRALEAFLDARAAQAPIAAPVPQPEAKAATPPSQDALREAEAARDEAERKSAAKSQFIAKLSHEMRNPLNAIIGFSEIMQQKHFGPLGDRRYETYADDIRASADHLLSLVDDLLDIARIEEGKLKLTFVDVTLGPLIEECVRMLKPAAAGYKVSLSAQVGALPAVIADARSLKQVVINLISNALKFTVAGGQVRVAAAAKPGGGIVISISDTGVGMTPADIAHALEPFGQVDGPHQRKRKGTGLGLPLAKAMAEANLCGFEIASAPDKGTMVRIVFPPERVRTG